MAKIYCEETEKDQWEIIDDLDTRFVKAARDPSDTANEAMQDEGMPTKIEDFEYLEHRTFGDYDFGVDKHMVRQDHLEAHKWGWNPYE